MPFSKSFSQEGSLQRCLGFKETITITTGTVIGVGLFTVGANVVGLLGPAVILATLAALAVSIYPALLYAEMSAALPLAGGTYQYATWGLGRIWGILAGWNFIISMVAVASGEALAFSFYLRTLLEALGLTLPFSDSFLAAIAILAFILLGIRGVAMTGRMQNGFLFFFWGVALVWICTMLPRLAWSDLTFFPATASFTWQDFLPCVALIWWCFAGFETCCAMGEEIRHPQINLPRALFLAPFLVFAVNGLFQWVLACLVPSGSLPLLAEATAPYAEAMRLAGVIGFPLILLCAGIAFGGDFSTLNACVTAPARYLFTMARDGALPAIFAKVHPRYGTPALAIITLGALMVLLVCTNSVPYIASLSLFATLFYYIIGIAAAWGLRRRQPQLTRTYRAPGICLGVPLSILCYAFMMSQLDLAAIGAGLLWCLFGLLLTALCRKKRPPLQQPNFATLLPPPPSIQEKYRLDQQFRRWRNVVCIAVLAVCGLYVLILFI